MDELFELKESIEELSLIVNARNSEISARDLIDYLSNYEQLVKSINCTLNSKYSIGYDIVKVEIKGLNEGSFEIKSILKKLSDKAIDILLGMFLTQLFTSNQDPVIINITGDNVVVEMTDLINKDIINCRSRIARVANNDPNVDGIAFEIETNTGNKDIVLVDRDALNAIIVDDEDVPIKESHWQHNTTMIIIGPVLENEPANWKVRIGDRKFSAKMTDSKFLSLMDKEKIAFGINDYIIADLETIVTINEGVNKSVKHYIRNVYSYPKYKQQTNLALF